MRVRHLMTALALTGIMTTGAAAACGGKHHGYKQQGCGTHAGMHHRGGKMKHLLFSLGLNPEQQEAVEKILVEKHYKMRAMRNESGGANKAFADAITNDGFDEAGYVKAASEYKEKKLQLKAAYFTRLMKVLNPPQRAELKHRLGAMDKQRRGCRK